MQMDQGKIHQSSMLDWPENMIPIFQPPYSPELNPIERYWEHLKAQLKWHNCGCLDELRSSLKKALEEITPEAISSITGWNFITNAVVNLS
jgi:transposase